MGWEEVMKRHDRDFGSNFSYDQLKQIRKDEWFQCVAYIFEICFEKKQPLFIAHSAFHLMAVYVAKRKVIKLPLDLVAITCFWIASKMWSPYHLELKDMHDLSYSLFTSKQLTRAELTLLSVCDWQAHRVTCIECVLVLIGRWSVPPSSSELAKNWSHYALFFHLMGRLQPLQLAICLLLMGDIWRCRFHPTLHWFLRSPEGKRPGFIHTVKVCFQTFCETVKELTIEEEIHIGGPLTLKEFQELVQKTNKWVQENLCI